MDNRKTVLVRRKPPVLLEEDKDTGNLHNVRTHGSVLHFEVQGFGRTMVVNGAEAVNLAAWLVALAPNGEDRIAAVLEHIKRKAPGQR